MGDLPTQEGSRKTVIVGIPWARPFLWPWKQRPLLENLDRIWKFTSLLFFGVFFSEEPCFQGRPILYFMNTYAFTLPLQGYVPRPFISISFSPPDLRGIRSMSPQQQSVFGSVNATDWATGAELLFFVIFGSDLAFRQTKYMPWICPNFFVGLFKWKSGKAKRWQKFYPQLLNFFKTWKF